MSCGLSADVAVDQLPQNVGVAVVAGHLLDHVARDQDPGERLTAAWPLGPIVQGRSGRDLPGTSGLREVENKDLIGRFPGSICQSASGSASVHGNGGSSPAKTAWNHHRSTYARCLIIPRMVIPDGTWLRFRSSSLNPRSLRAEFALAVEECHQHRLWRRGRRRN